MLTLGAGSACDICLEPFGTGLKAASAISCGHCFCSECINSIRASPTTVNHPDPTYRPCPLCRSTFDTRQYIRLHIDHDSSHPALRKAAKPSAAELEAQSHLAKITDIIDNGCSEEEATTCINDIRMFLRLEKDLTKFSELRTCYRVMKFLVATMTDQRDIDATVKRLRNEISELRARPTQTHEKYQEMAEKYGEAVRKAAEEKATAVSIEKSLQEHAKMAQEGYEQMIVHCNNLASELSKVCNHLLQQRDSDTHRDDPSRAYHHPSTRELASSISQRLEAYHTDLKRGGRVVTNPENHVVSPLAMFSALPTQTFSALPEERGSSAHPHQSSAFRPRSATVVSTSDGATAKNFSATQSTNGSPSPPGIRNHMLQVLLQDTISSLSSSSQKEGPSSSSHTAPTSTPSKPRRGSHKPNESGSSGLRRYTLPQPSELLAQRQTTEDEWLGDGEPRLIPPLDPAPARSHPMSFGPDFSRYLNRTNLEGYLPHARSRDIPPPYASQYASSSRGSRYAEKNPEEHTARKPKRAATHDTF